MAHLVPQACLGKMQSEESEDIWGHLEANVGVSSIAGQWA